MIYPVIQGANVTIDAIVKSLIKHVSALMFVSIVAFVVSANYSFNIIVVGTPTVYLRDIYLIIICTVLSILMYNLQKPLFAFYLLTMKRRSIITSLVSRRIFQLLSLLLFYLGLKDLTSRLISYYSNLNLNIYEVVFLTISFLIIYLTIKDVRDFYVASFSS